MKKIEIHNPANLPTIDYRKLTPLQGNLKDFHQSEYEKLTRSIEKYGFRVPVFVWPHNGKNYILDGHGRHRWLTRENATPRLIPMVKITAGNLTEAKEILLVITSSYQRITQDGLDEFTSDMNMDWVEHYAAFQGVYTESSRITSTEDIRKLYEAIQPPSVADIDTGVRYYITLEFIDEANRQAAYLQMIHQGFTVSNQFFQDGNKKTD